MARYVFRLPDIGEGIAEAEIVAWHVRLGDRVEEDSRLADMMTDKATVEMESPVAGRVVELAGEVGDTVAIGSPLVVLDVEGEGSAELSAEREPAEPALPEAVPSEPSPVETESEPEPEPEVVLAPPPRAPASATTPSTSETDRRVMASPAVRKRARDLGIDLAEVRPTGEGRIRHSDLDAFLSYNAAGGYQPAGRTGEDEQIRVIGLRRRIAEKMALSKRNIPHFSYVEECDVTALEEARAQLNARREADRGERPRLTMLPFLITAICRLVPDYPMINARFDDEAGIVTRHGAVHLGMATQTLSGLTVPVIRDAQTLNLWQLASEIARLARAARDGSATSRELSGSTLTVTSLGPLGGIATTPVINHPEVAIIGPNRIVERPVFMPDGMAGERIEKRKLMNISISCDHRVVDGWDAANFMQDIKGLIESPARLLAG